MNSHCKLPQELWKYRNFFSPPLCGPLQCLQTTGEARQWFWARVLWHGGIFFLSLTYGKTSIKDVIDKAVMNIKWYLISLLSKDDVN